MMPVWAARRRAMMAGGDKLPPIGTKLNDCTWAQIDMIASHGLGEEYFKVGDRKTVALDGTVGSIKLNLALDAYIIGFNHNGAANAIDFGTFKNADGVDVCLFGSGVTMNPGPSNLGGWAASRARQIILGSDSSPADPTPSTLLSCLPADLRAVMKPMTIYTDNSDSIDAAEASVTATVDYLPLLSEYEIFGGISYGNEHEKDKQARYKYYSSSTSRIRYRFNSPTTKIDYWTRSRALGTGLRYATCSTLGYQGTANSSTTNYGMNPIFRV